MIATPANQQKCLQCQKPASMKCPICSKLKLQTPMFCSQECFKIVWPEHKLLHDAANSSEHSTTQVIFNSHVLTQSAHTSDNTPQWALERPEFKNFKFECNIRPRKLTPRRTIPKHITAPDYAYRDDGESMLEKFEKVGIVVNNQDDIEAIREACRLGVIVMETAGNAVKVGVTTDEIDRIVHEKCIQLGVYPSPLNYYKFPKSCCTSVNEVICHGIPDCRPLEDGDILNVDITVYHNGYHADMNETYLVGNVAKVHEKLVKTAYECLESAISICRPGQMYRQIGECISKRANKAGFSVVRSYCGHGIGKLFHSNPNVPHYANNKAIGVMKPGHVFTIEPMINEGSWRDRLWTPDNWTVTTIDNGYSAQFEHTILITEDGCQVLTRRNRGSYIDRFFDSSETTCIASQSDTK